MSSRFKDDDIVVVARYKPWASIYYSTFFLVFTAPLVWFVWFLLGQNGGNLWPTLTFLATALALLWKWLDGGLSVLVDSVFAGRRAVYITKGDLIFVTPALFKVPISKIEAASLTDVKWRGEIISNIEIVQD